MDPCPAWGHEDTDPSWQWGCWSLSCLGHRDIDPCPVWSMGRFDPCSAWGHRDTDPCPARGHGKMPIPSLLWGQHRQHSTAPLAGCARQLQGPSAPPEPPSSGPPVIVGLPAHLITALGAARGSSSWEVPWKPPRSCTRARRGALGPSSCFLPPFPPHHPAFPAQRPCSQPLSSVPSLPLPTPCFLLGNTQDFFSFDQIFQLWEG